MEYTMAEEKEIMDNESKELFHRTFHNITKIDAYKRFMSSKQFSKWLDKSPYAKQLYSIYIEEKKKTAEDMKVFKGKVVGLYLQK